MIGELDMEISQLEFESIIHEVAENLHFDVEINGTDVYLTYGSHKNPNKRRLLDFDDNGKITGRCTTNGGVQQLEVKPRIFAREVYDSIQELFNE